MLDKPVAAPIAVFLIGVLLHADRIPLWSTAAILACALWRLAAEASPVRLPGRTARLVLMAALFVAVWLTFRTINGLSAGTALLALMGGVKLLETRSRRDRYIVIGAGLFLLLAACLDRQSLLRAPLYLAHACLALAAFASVGDESRALGPREALGLAARALLLALPLALLLFLFFPRLSGAFWALPQRSEAITGLGEEMSPGSIAELTESSEIVFRVRFEGEAPPPAERYWRGPVLHDFDGYTWRRGTALFKQTPLEYLGAPYRYRVTLEPHARRWLFALELPKVSPDLGVFFRFDYQLVSMSTVDQPVSYELTSYTRTRAAEALTDLGHRYGTKLPDGRNRRARALALEMHARSPDDAAYAQAVLELFRTGGFEYTLTPPRTDFDFVDDFIFETRRGFCGHFASAYVAMMRAADVPARVVTGYLGAEWNPIGRYYIVRQSDAHAWAEVWLEGRGWTRIDPTAVVAPERLTRGLLDVLPGAVSAPARFVHERRWLAQAMLAWDALDAWWSEEFVKFDFASQLALLAALGLEAPSAQTLALAFAGALALWLAWLGWQLRRAIRGRRPDPLAREWLAFCRKLERVSPRAAHEGALDYARRIGALRPDLAPSVREIASRYARLRFGPEAPPAAIDELRRAVAYFRA